MKIRAFFLILLTGLLPSSACHRAAVKKTEVLAPKAWANVVAFADEHLPKSGILMQKSDGYAYVKVDDRYIHELFPRLHVDGAYKKPPYFRREDSPGAHISVVYENEHVKLKEEGQRFNFTLRGIKLVPVNPSTSYIVLEVASPELEKLRESYGLFPKLNHHEFHITLAKRTDQKAREKADE